eukprot:CAMPEP_0180050106 /NCGR_PEP_ID=MMETSP0985-20121206/403_1 /TAXON_ID=483367 /ORGANISM="non described non described, Strain CCMP 2436" /LENGTH=51 /DNA_ID=CAMNT_0021979183 /DNA_START=502 /DNA_END=657 /DNA_ORIENTATION=+
MGGWDEDDSGTWQAAAAATRWQGHWRVRQLNDLILQCRSSSSGAAGDLLER